MGERDDWRGETGDVGTDSAAGRGLPVSRRRALVGGAATLAAGGHLLAPRSAVAQPAAAQAPRARAVGAEAWRRKVARGSTLERHLEAVQRIRPDRPLPPGLPGRDYTPVVTPDNFSLPFRIVDGVKVFHLIAEPVKHEFAEGIVAHCWGYNGHTNGPTIEAVEGERVRIYVTNRLPAPTSVHWHGFILPFGMDGIPGLEHPAIFPGETFRYEFTIRQHGTFMYHSHHDTMTQDGMGLTGMFILHPRRALHTLDELGPPVDRDFAILLQEWRVEVGAARPNVFSTAFNLFTMNGRVFPGTEPLVARQGQRVRLRFGNLSAVDHHPIHLHGYEFAVTAENGHRIPPDRQVLKVTSLIPVGRTQDWELVALYEGDWVFHCHMTHHIMNQMFHGFTNTVGMVSKDLDSEYQKLLPDYMTMATAGMNDRTGRPRFPIPPNSIPMKNSDGLFGPIPFGGMTSVLKVRANISDEMLARNADPGPYRSPPEDTALPATPEELARDGVRL